MMGNRSELFKQETLKADNVSNTLARLGGYFGKFWYMIIFALLLVTLSTWTQVINPELIGQATDCFLVPMGSQFGSFGPQAAAQSENSASACWLGTTDPAALTFTRQLIHKAYTWNDYPVPTASGMTNDQRIAGLFRLVSIIVGLYVMGALVTGLMFLSVSWTGYHVIRAMRLDVFRHLHELSLSYYSEHEAGDLMSRITNDTSAIEQAVTFALVQVFSGPYFLISVSYNMLKLSLPFGLLSL